MNEYFTKASDLKPTKQSYLKKANNIGMSNPKTTLNAKKDFKPKSNIENNDKNSLIGDINNYLSYIVSGEKYPYESEFGIVKEAGRTFVTFERLKEMVDEGCYNFASAKVINPKMIEIEFQKLEKENTKLR